MFKAFVSSIKKENLLFIALVAFCINIIVEVLARRGIVDFLSFLIKEPVIFIANAVLIFATLVPAAFFRRRVFVLSLFSAIWIICGIINCVLSRFRITPFSVNDFMIIGAGRDVVSLYLSGFQLALIVFASLAVGFALYCLWKKAPKQMGKIPYLRIIIAFVISVYAAAAMGSVVKAQSRSIGYYSKTVDVYSEYGFALSFVYGFFDIGIERPGDYSTLKVSRIKKQIQNKAGVFEPEVFPNIIFVQLESFTDVTLYGDINLTQNPVPNFTRLRSEYGGGALSVPVVGGGTVNTEFEVLTGISLGFFGINEYPYKTELMDKQINSICTELEKFGYATTAVHNNTGEFYARGTVLSNLGFDTFRSLEHMHNAEFNPLGWVKDAILFDEINRVIKDTNEVDFIYAISVQAHGKYPSEPLDNAPYNIKIQSSANELEEDFINQYEYYINQLHEMDALIGALTDYYTDFDEPVVIVFFGDHLPALEPSRYGVADEMLYQTQYVIWSNFDLPVIKKDIHAFELSAQVFSLLGFDGGYIINYNNFFADSRGYPDKQHYLAYEMFRE